MIRKVTDDWLILLHNGPLTIQEMVVLSNCGKETVYRAMYRHEKRGYTRMDKLSWSLTDAGRERVEILLGKTATQPQNNDQAGA